MQITPSSTITLYANVDIDNGEQLVFSTREKQVEYFTSKKVRDYVPCTMIRKNGAVRVEIAGSVVKTCNYLSFVNPAFDNKTVYARIIDYDYVNNECVDIAYYIDFWQTWMFDVQFEDMYIEREHLSQADYLKSVDNPYDPTIFEFRTNESLPVAKDLEKLNYTIGSSQVEDGYKLGDAVSNRVQGISNTVGALIKLAEIDFEKLDSGADPDLSRPFVTYLRHIRTHTFSCYHLTQTMYDYLAGKYGTSAATGVPAKNFTGSGWCLDGDSSQKLVPFFTSNFQPGCCWIYDQYGGEENMNGVGTNNYMSELLTILTRWEAVGQIISMNAIPNDIFILAGVQENGGAPLNMNQSTAKTKISVDSKKLMRYPYSYLRVIAPNGDVKELHYEFFKAVQEGTDNCSIPVVLDVADQPTAIIVPENYRISGMANGANVNTNVLEGLLFAQFPSIPYTIDAYTAQVAANANSIIAGRTVDGAWQMAATDVATDQMSQGSKVLQSVAGLVKGGVDAASGVKVLKDIMGKTHVGGAAELGMAVFSSIASTSAMYAEGSSMEAARKQFENAEAMWKGAESALAGEDGNAIAANMRLTKPAYACDKYIPSNGVGTINFNKQAFCDIICLRVTLSADILAIYDKWFQHYGYTSGRCGIPRVIQFARGANSDANLPHWTTVNNKPTTYIKTMDCKVIYSMVPVASFIKNMFDSGVRLIKGDLT